MGTYANIIKILGGLLILSFALGILTSGNSGQPDENPGVSGANQANSTAETGKEPAKASQVENKSEVLGKNETLRQEAFTSPAGKSEMSIKRRYIESRVRTAARLIEEKEEDLFPELREKGSWYSDNFYVFVWDTNGMQLVYPPDSKQEGKDQSKLLASDGKPIVNLFLEATQSKEGEGWVKYQWKKTKTSTPSSRYVFIKKVSSGGQAYFVGSGFYPDDFIISRNQEECKTLNRPGNITVCELFSPRDFQKDLYLNYSLARSVVSPGESTSPHMMRNPEVHYILGGEGLLYIDGIPVQLREGQVVYIPAGSVQTEYNTGKTNLTFLAINQPAWAEENEEIFEGSP